MAPNQPQQGSAKGGAGGVDEQWTEQQLENALKELDEQYRMLRALRSTIPTLISPLAVKHESPQSFYKAFTNTIDQSQSSINQFRQRVTSPKTKAILQHAAKSDAKNPENIQPWRITDHPDWHAKQS